ncbi:MAG: hypothetical protein FI687_02250 [SAR202 cluster bacterium]|nr:hypothetical protein [SAR202 cluster bacterium]|tara:strand:+ start:2173 stop:3084 length:912 start_codon:yes stop_codon:yes gene_type:complete
MNKISIKTIMFFILLITTNIACNSITPTDNNLNSNRSSEQTKYPIDILDSNEENIRIYEPVQKMIVLDSAAVEILFAIGEGDKIVGTHSFISHPEEAKQIAKVGDAFSINIEKIIEQEPDLVYIFFDKFAEELNKNNLKVLYIKTLENNFSNISDQILMWGKITNSTNEAKKLTQQFNNQIETIKSKINYNNESPKIFIDTTDLWTSGPNTLMGEVLELLNLSNIAHDISGYAQLSPEIIIERNPDFIITPNPKTFLDNPAFKEVSAIKNKQIFTLKSDALSVAGPRFPEGINELASLIYPEW